MKKTSKESLSAVQIIKVEPDNILQRKDNEGNALRDVELRFWINYHMQVGPTRKEAQKKVVDDYSSATQQITRQLGKIFKWDAVGKALNVGVVSDQELQEAVELERGRRRMIEAQANSRTVAAQPRVFDSVPETHHETAMNELQRAQEKFFKEHGLNPDDIDHIALIAALSEERRNHDGNRHFTHSGDEKYDYDDVELDEKTTHSDVLSPYRQQTPRSSWSPVPPSSIPYADRSYPIGRREPSSHAIGKGGSSRSQ